MQLFIKDASYDSNVVFDSIKIYIERIERPKNFLHNDIEEETRRRILVHNDIVQQTMLAHRRVVMEEGIEQQLKLQKEKQIKDNLAQIREEEKEQLD